jgi:predicted phage replisome organizer
MDIRWIKIVTDIFDDEKILLIGSMPEADALIVIWFKLLCLSGKCNASGVLMLNDRIAYTDEMLATIFRRPLNTVRLALTTFENFGMIEIVEGAITIPNWGKHQSIDRIEKKNEYMRKYMRDYRAKQKLLVECKTNSKANVSRTDIDIDIDKEHSSSAEPKDGRFDEFWTAYPKKVGKAAAKKAYAKIKPTAELHEQMLRAIDTAKRSDQWQRDNGQYIPHPTTWLNRGGWDDELETQDERRYKRFD